MKFVSEKTHLLQRKHHKHSESSHCVYQLFVSLEKLVTVAEAKREKIQLKPEKKVAISKMRDIKPPPEVEKPKEIDVKGKNFI